MTNKEAIELLKKALGCVQTDHRNCGECKECKNYATKEDGIEAIRMAIAALEKADANCPEIPDSWIPIKAHPATDEERESHPDIDYWLDCEMPDDGQEILVTVKHKNWIGVEKDVCHVDSEYSLDSGYDWDDIIAWMPLPEPYKEGE